MRKSALVLSVLIVAALLIAAAAPLYAAPAPRPYTLKVGLLPILDVLPFYVAEDAGYFDDEYLEVELIPVSSALERDQLLIAGQIDGMVNDLVSTGIFNQDKTRVQIVAMARRAYPDSPQFRILAAPGSDISTPADLAGVEIGISENSVIHYISQRILEEAGLNADDMEFIPEPNIPVRFQLLMEGQFKAVCLPDPLGQAAVEGGAILVADDTALVDQEFSQSVISFRTEVIEDQPEAVEAFLRAWMRAAEDINADPDTYRDLWKKNTTVPDSVKDTYVLPPFPTYAITQPLAWDDTMAWLLEQDIIDEVPAYEGSVNTTFLEAITPEALAGDAANGEVLFRDLGCFACHAVDSDAAMAGPSLRGIASFAGERVEGQSAQEYLVTSVVDPGAFLVEGYGNITPSYDLSDSEVADLVAYLLTLE